MGIDALIYFLPAFCLNLEIIGDRDAKGTNIS